MTKSPTAGVIVGRFQVPSLHAGHLALLTVIEHRHEKLVIFIGDRNTPVTATNPLSYEIRAAMIRDVFPKAIICRLVDMKSNERWSEQLDSLIRLYAPEGATLYSGRDGFIPWYSGTYPTEELSFGFDDVDATSLRQKIATQYTSTDQFRAGVIHAMQTLTHRTYNTVDIAFYRTAPSLQIALGRRKVEDAWRLPGGFREPGELLVDAARRELKEEMCVDLESPPVYVKEYMINDWRLRGAKGVDHSTTLFLGQYSWGALRAGDDLDVAQWFDLEYVMRHLDTLIVEEHRYLIQDIYPLLTSDTHATA